MPIQKMLALDSTRLLHINEIEWSEKKAKIFGKLCAAPKMKSQNQQLCFLYWCFEWHKKTARNSKQILSTKQKMQTKKKVSRRLLEKSQLFVFMVKAPQTSNQFQKSLELYQIYVTRNICPGQPQSEWFSIENEFIVTKNSNKKLTIKKEQIQFLFKAANRSKGNTEQCVFP